jgi:exonuclease VII large subunit
MPRDLIADLRAATGAALLSVRPTQRASVEHELDRLDELLHECAVEIVRRQDERLGMARDIRRLTGTQRDYSAEELAERRDSLDRAIEELSDMTRRLRRRRLSMLSLVERRRATTPWSTR